MIIHSFLQLFNKNPLKNPSNFFISIPILLTSLLFTHTLADQFTADRIQAVASVMASGSERIAVTGEQIGYDLDFNPHVSHVSRQVQLRGEYNRQRMAVVTGTETDSGESDAALSIPPLLSSSSVTRPLNTVTNLESFLDSVTPIVPARKPREVNSSGQESREADIHPYYCIGDLWETFQERSAYGVGVPFLLHGEHPTTQYYVPYLSGMQLYIDPKKVRCPAKENDVDSHEPGHGTSSDSARSFDALNLNHQKLKPVLLRENKTEAHGSRGTLAFEFMEQEQPHTRKSLADKVSVLASQYPELNKYRSCDLSPSSWICVAWYPIYRIPVGPTLKDLEASFLTLHALSTQPGSYSESELRSGNAYGVHDTLDLSSKIRLPVIGLASYKLKGSIISPCDPQEREQENALFEAANNWLKNLKPPLPDYQFFLKRY